MRLELLAALGAALRLGGCVEKWTKPGGTAEEFDAMKASCQAQAYQQFPPQLQQIQASNGYYTPITTNCYGTGYGTSCYQSGGQYIPPIIITVDTNRSPRGDAVRGCFYSNGWTPATADQSSAAPSPASAASSTCNPGFDCN
jgi:hypothetical protein